MLPHEKCASRVLHPSLAPTASAIVRCRSNLDERQQRSSQGDTLFPVNVRLHAYDPFPVLIFVLSMITFADFRCASSQVIHGSLLGPMDQNDPLLEVLEPELERQLATIRESPAGSVAGVFGPDSVIWRIDREAAVFLGAGRALLLQLAHPWVAAGIAQHSQTLSDPIGRFHRTFNVVFTMVFGTLDQALAKARHLHRRHAAIRGHLAEASGRSFVGSAYYANEISALAWVHATLIDTALLAHDLVLPPLRPQEREQYYAEHRRFGALFGIPGTHLPRDWEAFTGYVSSMFQSATLSVTPAARKIADELFSGIGLPRPLPRWYRAVTAGMLPQRVRDGFGLPYAEVHRCSAERALAMTRRIYPLLPTSLRYVGPYQEACGRLAGRHRPSTVTRFLNRIWIGQSQMTAD